MQSLLSRASVSSVGEPGPGDADLRSIFEAAVRAPDHGKLRPWRFFVVRGNARARLSELFASASLRRDPNTPPAQIEKDRGKLLSTPVIIVVAAKILPAHKIPEIEQILATAAAAMNILNAAHALGFGAKLVTGPNCYDPEFRAAMGIDDSHQIIGFIHVGTPVGNPQAPERPDAAGFVVEWTGGPSQFS